MSKAARTFATHAYAVAKGAAESLTISAAAFLCQRPYLHQLHSVGIVLVSSMIFPFRTEITVLFDNFKLSKTAAAL